MGPTDGSLCLRGGAYRQNLSLSAAAAAGIEIRSYPGESALLQGSTTVNGDGITFHNFRVDGAYGAKQYDDPPGNTDHDADGSGPLEADPMDAPDWDDPDQDPFPGRRGHPGAILIVGQDFSMISMQVRNHGNGGFNGDTDNEAAGQGVQLTETADGALVHNSYVHNYGEDPGDNHVHGFYI